MLYAVAAGASIVLALRFIVYRVLVAAHRRPVGPTAHSHAASRPGGIEHLVLGVVDGVVRLLLRLGLRLGPMALLTVRGRRTGQPRTNPVDWFERDGRSWLVATHAADAQWVRNLRAAGEGSLWRGRDRVAFRTRELPLEQAGAMLKDVLGPRLARPLAGVVLRQTLGVPADAPLAEFVRAAERHPVFELTRLPAAEPVPELGSDISGSGWSIVAIGAGLFVALAHAALGLAGVLGMGQWLSAAVLGLLLTGVGNRLRIFGHP